MGILGFSAGGSVCCSAATHFDAGDPQSADPVQRFSSRPDVFVPCYAVASFGKYTHLDSRKCLLGKDWENEDIARWYSAEENVTDDTPDRHLQPLGSSPRTRLALLGSPPSAYTTGVAYSPPTMGKRRLSPTLNHM